MNVHVQIQMTQYFLTENHFIFVYFRPYDLGTIEIDNVT